MEKLAGVVQLDLGQGSLLPVNFGNVWHARWIIQFGGALLRPELRGVDGSTCLPSLSADQAQRLIQRMRRRMSIAMLPIRIGNAFYLGSKSPRDEHIARYMDGIQVDVIISREKSIF